MGRFILEYPGRPSVVNRSLKEKKGGKMRFEYRIIKCKKGLILYLLDTPLVFEDGGRSGGKSRGMQEASRSRKGKEMDSSLEPPEGTSPTNTLILAL